MSKSVYLDHAAATPVRDEVVGAMQPYLNDSFYNPSSIYLSARAIRQEVEEARHRVAKVIGARSDEIIFTSGATESCNLAIKGVMQLHPGSEVITSTIEHEAVIQPAERFKHVLCPVDQKGLLDVGKLSKQITDKTVLISVIYANNEIGTVQNLSEIAELVEQIRSQRRDSGNKLPLYLHSDAAQAASYLNLHVSRLGVDLLTLNGGKMYGPKQTGILYVGGGVQLQPQIEGGSQQWKVRSGTENVPGIMGFTRALELAQDERKDEAHRQQQLRDDLIKSILKLDSKLTLNGHSKKRLPNNVNISIGQDVDGERLVMMLDELGFEVSTGAACSALSDEDSHVLKAIGLPSGQARSSLRISLGKWTTKEQLDDFVKALEKCLKSLQHV